jgi:hypothetical protein
MRNWNPRVPPLHSCPEPQWAGNHGSVQGSVHRAMGQGDAGDPPASDLPDDADARNLPPKKRRRYRIPSAAAEQAASLPSRPEATEGRAQSSGGSVSTGAHLDAKLDARNPAVRNSAVRNPIATNISPNPGAPAGRHAGTWTVRMAVAATHRPSTVASAPNRGPTPCAGFTHALDIGPKSRQQQQQQWSSTTRAAISRGVQSVRVQAPGLHHARARQHAVLHRSRRRLALPEGGLHHSRAGTEVLQWPRRGAALSAAQLQQGRSAPFGLLRAAWRRQALPDAELPQVIRGRRPLQGAMPNPPHPRTSRPTPHFPHVRASSVTLPGCPPSSPRCRSRFQAILTLV